MNQYIQYNYFKTPGVRGINIEHMDRPKVLVSLCSPGYPGVISLAFFLVLKFGVLK